MTLPVQSLFAEALRAIGAPAPAQISPLVPEASARRYYRLTLADPSTALRAGSSTALRSGDPKMGRRVDSSTIVGVHEDPVSAKTNMPLVTAVQNFLAQHHAAVPAIYFTDVDAGIMLQQDLGDLSLNQALRENSDQADTLYKEAITRMFGWQRLSDDGQCPAFRMFFDIEKLMFEFGFFITHTLLGYYGAQMTAGELRDIRATFLKIAEALAAPKRKFFTHRDYHSRNIMLFEDKQYIIDFQDARLGLVQYDLSSLLCDAYAPLPREQRAALVDFAFETGKDIHRQSRDEFAHFFTWSAFQRLVKAMGTFGRQAGCGRKDFANCLPPAMEILSAVSDHDGFLRGLTSRIAAIASTSQASSASTARLP